MPSPRPSRWRLESTETKLLAHLAATLLSWALAVSVSRRARQLCAQSSPNMDMLGLLLGLIQLGVMYLPYIGYHASGGPVLFPPISCANNYTWLRRAATWAGFSLLAGGVHAWTILTSMSNPVQAAETFADFLSYLPPAGLILLAGNPVPLRDYVTAFAAPGTEAEWMTPAAYRHAVSKLTARNRPAVRLLMAAHLLGALLLIVAPSISGLFRREWYTKLCACFALALFVGHQQRLPIYRMASSQLSAKVMETYAGAPGWQNQLNAPRRELKLWKLINELGVAEHLLLNSLMLVMLSYQHHDEVQGLGWASRMIALLWNAGFASFGGEMLLSMLLRTATKIV
mmetsp:Transcript_354/g.972  ORF Transcript_354/g.972 Transcript_354/m.972 type:complete len:342 (+) Transcript_354:166-1191(+)